MGYQRIAVTVNGFKGENLREIRDIEKIGGARVYIFVVCTGVAHKRIDEIKSYADLVWSCGSREIREQVRENAILQFSRSIPVFVLTENGMGAAKAYFETPEGLNDFSGGQQLLVCDDCQGEKVKVGNFWTRLCAAKLPALGKRIPVFSEEAACK